jgi:hypothetical protein
MFPFLLFVPALRASAQVIQAPAAPVSTPLEAPVFEAAAPLPLAPGLGAAPDLPGVLDPHVEKLEALLAEREADPREFALLLQKAKPLLGVRNYERLVRHVARRAFGAGATALLPEPDHVRTTIGRKGGAEALYFAFSNGWGAPEKERAAFVEWTDVLTSQPPLRFEAHDWHELAFDQHGHSRAASAQHAYLYPIYRVAEVIRSRPEWTTPGTTSLLLGALGQTRAAREVRASAPASWTEDAVNRLKRSDWIYSHLSGALISLADKASQLVEREQARAIQAELEHWATEPGAPAEQAASAVKLAYRYGAIAEERALVLRSDLAPAAAPAIQRRIDRLETIETVGSVVHVGAWIGVAGAMLGAIIAGGGWIVVPAMIAVGGVGQAVKATAGWRKRKAAAAAAADEKARAALVDDTYLETLGELDVEFPSAPILKK